MNGEHLFSAWIGRLLNYPKYSWKFIDPDTGEIREWQASLDLKIKAVCESCNSGWMSRLETEAKYALSDMIKYGSKMSLLPRGIATLSAFAFKSAVIATCMNRNHEPFFTRADRENFRSSQSLPSKVQMWISCLQDIAMTGTFIGHVFGLNVPSGTNRHGIQIDDLESYAFTYSAGYLAFQVLACRHGKIANRGKPLPILRPNLGWDDAVVQFWPHSGAPITWPPLLNLNSDSLNALANRWRNAITFLP